jgi:tungstate transport system permease protein
LESLGATTLEALHLLFSGDAELWDIAGVSFRVSLSAIGIAAIPAIVLGFILAMWDFPGRWMMVALFNTLMAVPTVVVGLTLYLLLSRVGPLGEWRLLFSQPAMVAGQILLSFPILVSMSHSAFQAIDKRAWETARTLGANLLRAMLTLWSEARFALLGVLIAAFGRIISEVGCSMMVGGNILGFTRNIPTAIALETSKGEFAQGVALGIVLLVLALTLNFLLAVVRGKGRLV